MHSQAERELVEEKKLSNDLLMNMLPRDIALRLKVVTTMIFFTF